MHDQIRAVIGSFLETDSSKISELESTFTEVGTEGRSFESAARVVAGFQRVHIEVYGRYWDALEASTIPFLPVRVFKDVPLIAGDPRQAEAVFLSSGTGRQGRSRHFVRKLSVYDRSFLSHFERLFGGGPFTIVAHLPVYADTGSSSSLVYMARGLIERFGDPASGFFLRETTLFSDAIRHSRREGTPLILLGAAFGLLDLAEAGSWRLSDNSIVIETGGMKTQRREIGRESLHDLLAAGFGLDRARIWSEYGMCELLSQCYAQGGGVFFPPPWMSFEIREIDNPLRTVTDGKPGLLAVMDLANMYSVSSVLTEDVAVGDGSGFRLLGRVRGSELRGCNLLLENLDTA